MDQTNATLWPFDSETVALYFAQSATDDMNEVEEVVFHFIAKCGYNPGHPILVHQQLISVEETPRDPKGISEYWRFQSGWLGRIWNCQLTHFAPLLV